MVGGVKRLFNEYNGQTLERVWQILFKIYTQVLRVTGHSEFETELDETEKWPQKGMLQSTVDIDQEVHQKTLNWWAGDAESDGNE